MNKLRNTGSLTSTPPDPDSGGELSEVLAAAIDLGLRPQSGSYTLSVAQSVGRFESWLSELGLSLEEAAELAPKDDHGDPRISPAVVAAYLVAESRSSNRVSSSTRSALTRLAAGLRMHGWSVVEISGRSLGAQRLRALCDRISPSPADNPTKAHALTLDELGKLVELVESNPLGWRPLVVQATATWLVTCWMMSLRGGEAVAHLRWGMIDLDRHCVRLPGGIFKHQHRTHVLPMPPSPNESLSVSDRLKTWKIACFEAGMPSDNDALVFPRLRTYQRGCAHRTAEIMLERVFGEALFLGAPPIRVDDATTADMARLLASENSKAHRVSEYRHRWTRLIAVSSLGAEVASDRKLSTHSLRRGSATTASLNGASVFEIQQRLRHSTIAVTGEYIDRRLPDSRTLFDGLPMLEPCEGIVTELADNPDPKALKCGVMHEGAACGRALPSASFVELDGRWTPICPPHRSRLRRGRTGADLSAPIADCTTKGCER